jgi:hypothetical protein
MNLSNMRPIPLAWAPYFLDFKDPHAALQMGHTLIATLGTVEHRTRAGPILDWLRATCTRLGANAADQRRSLLDQGFEATAPDARVILRGCSENWPRTRCRWPQTSWPQRMLP